jgi:plasmid maintenance system antidote protein VapI
VFQYTFTNGAEELLPKKEKKVRGNHVLNPMTWLQFSMIIDALAQQWLQVQKKISLSQQVQKTMGVM